MEESSGGFRALLRSGAAIAIAMAVMNVAMYGYTVVVAHLVGPEAFGAFSAIMGVLLVVNVVSLGLQATGARQISAHPDRVVDIERTVLAVSVRSALVLGALCLALAPVLDRVLRLDSLPTAALVAAAAAPLTIMGGQAGVLQGERRWVPLALVYLAQGLGRVACGVGLLLVWRTEFAAVLGVAIGAWLPVLVGYVALRRPRGHHAPGQGAAIELIREVASSSQALLAFFALSNADILLARAFLSDRDAGLYAGGLILVKAVLFLPQFVAVVAFPSMATKGASGGTLVKALLVAGALGTGAMLGTLVLPDLALLFVGGEEFAAVKGRLWVFALVGTLLASIQLLLYAALARQQSRAILLIWSALVVVLCVAPALHSASTLVLAVLAIDGVLFVLLLAVTLTGRRTDPEVVPAEQAGSTSV